MSKKSIPMISAAIAFLLLLTSALLQKKLSESKVYAEDLMKKIKIQKTDDIKLDTSFIKITSNFSINLFKKSYNKQENSLISPVSIYMALGMTENGAAGDTLKEFENLLGAENMSSSQLNLYYHSLMGKLTNEKEGKVSIGNSIWYSKAKNLTVKKKFLQSAADYYNAEAYKSDFESDNTIKDINNWVKKNTGNQINKIVDKIDKNTVMYLINTIYFDEKWQQPYKKEDVNTGTFRLEEGTDKSVKFMNSEEYQYLNDDKVQGFIKEYKGGKFSFVALLPNEGISLENYLSSLTGEDFIKLINNGVQTAISVKMPIFEADYSLELADSLKEMGLKLCFDSNNADFSNMGSSSEGNIYVSNILHKAFISVNTDGTKAAAATKVEMKSGAAPLMKSIILNRPFLYAVIDNETKLPLFVGTMMRP
ncbi:serpin family protein [Clostridium sp. 19966]|uniref:serpin family protein n=1 Tax=Clostridium sp. 19966 TaxID=2768166 RepID=UPI0028DE5B19|nr:serpin family protein [Clostridium sp. 19966]MDT8719256.1 serpin family protein [Clostridium sp. 19966]